MSVPIPEVSELATRLALALRSRSATIATAESLTGGGLAHVLSAAPGSSYNFRGGVVAYATDLKQSLLEVSKATLADHGAVSAQCAAEMAVGVRAMTGADYAVSTTGVAGPDSQEDQPIGLVFVAVAGPSGVTTTKLRLSGDRAEVRAAACQEAVVAVLDRLVAPSADHLE